MSRYTPDQLLRKLEIAKARRLLYTDLWQDCYDYTMPARRGFFDETEGGERTQYIYDETAVDGLQEFASRMNQTMTPNFDIWFSLVPGVEIPKDNRRAVQGQLDELTRIVGEVILNSNFATQSPEVYLDLGLGWSTMLVEECRKKVVRFTTVPQPDVIWGMGPGNSVGMVFRERKQVPVEDIPLMYPTAKLSERLTADISSNPQRKVDIVECTYLDDGDKYQDTWCHSVIETAGKEFIIRDKEYSGEGACPWVTPRWSTVGGEIYGRGPVINVLPAIRTVNLTMQLILQNAEMAIGGIWQADDDGSLNVDTIRLVPGTIIPVDPTTNGLRNITPNSNFDVAQLVLHEMRDNIRRGLLNQNLGPLAQTPRSATEVVERQADLAEVMGASFGRLQHEFIQPVIARVIRIMASKGMIELPKVDGRTIAIRAVGPMARMQKFEKVQRMQQFAASMSANELLAMKVDWDTVAAYFRENYDLPDAVLLTPAKARQMAQAAQQAISGPGGPDNVRQIGG